MKEINKIIAVNLATLRKRHKLTQVELAEKLCYSDKAISKWENGETLPDIEVLNNLAQIYNVSLDYLVVEHEEEEKIIPRNSGRRNKIIITALSSLVIWMIATIIYVYLLLYKKNYWEVFIWAIPLSCIILIVFSSIWSRKKYLFISISMFLWTLLIAFYIQFLENNIWPIFLIGIPTQVAVILWSQIKSNH